MAIRVKCDSCGRAFRARSEDRGRQAKCPACGVPVVIDGQDVEEQRPVAAAPYYAPPKVAAYAASAVATPAVRAGPVVTLAAGPARRYKAPPLEAAEIMWAIIGGLLLIGTVSLGGYMVAQNPARYAKEEYAGDYDAQSRTPPSRQKSASPPPRPPRTNSDVREIPIGASKNSPPPIVINLKIPNVRTAVVGGTGGSPFETPGPGGRVVGFRYEVGQWMNQGIIRTLEPLYAREDGGGPGNPIKTVCARDGYAVYGVIVDGTQYVNAVRVIFARVENDRCVGTDTYQSDWIGVPQRDNQQRLAADGSKVVGTYGRKGLNLDAFGLFVMPENR